MILKIILKKYKIILNKFIFKKFKEYSRNLISYGYMAATGAGIYVENQRRRRVVDKKNWRTQS